MTFIRLLAALAAALAWAAPAQARTWQQVFPLQEQRTFTVASEGVTVTVAPTPPHDDEAEETDESLGESFGEEDATITVHFPGVPPFRVPADEHRSTIYGISVGIGRMAPGDAAPTVLLGGYSGGAHCCDTLQLVSLVDGEPTAVTLPMTDGEPDDAFPTDLDGDGERDIRREDDSLLYTFTGYAGSWPVPRYYNVRAGQPVDVSKAPGFARYYRRFARKALRECRAGGVENAGACAAYAHAMAQQGQAEEGIRAAVSLAREPVWYPLDCLVDEVDGECPGEQWRQFAGFEDALRWIMRKNGYLP